MGKDTRVFIIFGVGVPLSGDSSVIGLLIEHRTRDRLKGHIKFGVCTKWALPT